MTSTAMPVTCAATSWVVHPSHALTASGAVRSTVSRNASASALRSIKRFLPWSVASIKANGRILRCSSKRGGIEDCSRDRLPAFTIAVRRLTTPAPGGVRRAKWRHTAFMATVVAFHAHPDDEVVLTGGTLAKAVAAGHRVVVGPATDG